MKPMIVIMLFCVGVWASACSSSQPEKPKMRTPLPLPMSASAVAVQANEQGTKAYQSRQFDAAKVSFEQTVAAAPDSGEAHYNLGLTLFAMGDNDAAREHFMEAANLAPGNKVIWDSPALRQYGSPDPNIRKKKVDDSYTNQRPGLGSKPSGMSR